MKNDRFVALVKETFANFKNLHEISRKSTERVLEKFSIFLSGFSLNFVVFCVFPCLFI